MRRSILLFERSREPIASPLALLGRRVILFVIPPLGGIQEEVDCIDSDFRRNDNEARDDTNCRNDNEAWDDTGSTE